MHIWVSFKQFCFTNIIHNKNIYFKEIKSFVIKITLIYIENWITHIFANDTTKTIISN
jgi:hypothetical protein